MSHMSCGDDKPSTSGQRTSPFEAVVQLTRELQLADPYHNLTTLTLTNRGLSTLPDVLGELSHDKLLTLSDNPYAPTKPCRRAPPYRETALNMCCSSTLLCRASDHGTGWTATALSKAFHAASLGEEPPLARDCVCVQLLLPGLPVRAGDAAWYASRALSTFPFSGHRNLKSRSIVISSPCPSDTNADRESGAASV